MNMNAKKRVNGSWVDAPYYIHKTAADTFTTLPVDVYADGNNATVGLKGNTVQNGTPTPENPVDVQAVGDRTGNLFDYKKYFESTFTKYSEYFEFAEIQLKPFTAYTFTTSFSESTISGSIINTAFIIATSTEEPHTVKGGISSTRIATKTTEADGIIKIYKRIKGRILPKKEDFDSGMHWLMINEGDTALPYEPYGYKISILSANTATPVYLGEVETTRKIKKLVLTGEEKFFRDKERADSWRFYSMPLISAKSNVSICNHFAYIGTSLVNESDTIGFSIFNTEQFGCRCPKEIANTITEFKAFLAAQYAAGTPVCVWYVLATEETAVVNEPLMKIGDYADEVSNISIPTITGKNIVDVETVLKPSEVSFNYAGWHTAVVHKRINGAWD